jgi:hypothetical protein
MCKPHSANFLVHDLPSKFQAFIHCMMIFGSTLTYEMLLRVLGYARPWLSLIATQNNAY